jgi:hypothetical protein
MPYILIVNPKGFTGSDWERISGTGYQLLVGFIHANHRFAWIVWTLVHF